MENDAQPIRKFVVRTDKFSRRHSSLVWRERPDDERQPSRNKDGRSAFAETWVNAPKRKCPKCGREIILKQDAKGWYFNFHKVWPAGVECSGSRRAG